MKSIKIAAFIAVITVGFTACQKDKPVQAPAVFEQMDQMARPAINTVFVGTAEKDKFNTTTPMQMSSQFLQTFKDKLTAFGYTQNALGQDLNAFAGLLVTDVLNASLTDPTTFFDGVNVLTGRALADDVIDTELLLIFGGATGASNPGLTSDHVNANDKSFLGSFPYLATPH